MSILASRQRKVLLKITPEDPATEIFVIDGEFHLVERGVGRMSVSLAPGIYNVKLRAGVQTKEQLVLLTGDRPEEELKLDAFEFSSAAPLERTAKTHEFHLEAARALAGPVAVQAGQGSWIYVFARDWTSKERPEDPGPVDNPMRGLSLWDMRGNQVADLHQSDVRGGDWDPCAGCNVAVDPGPYRLRLELPAGAGTVERVIIAPRGWQAQVFLMQTDYGRGPSGREADLSRGSVFLSRSTSFDPARPSHRLTELARLALSSGRRRVSAELRKSLEGQIEDPMLGIYGAHLLLLEQEPDYKLLSDVVGQLRGLVGTHLDVEAVALKLPGHEAGDYLFESPPMLRGSWSCVVEATSAQRRLVPAESLAGRISTRLWGDGLWLAWATPPAETRAAAAEEDAEQRTLNVIKEALASELRHLQDAAESARLTPRGSTTALGRTGEALAATAALLLGRFSYLLLPMLKSIFGSSVLEVKVEPEADDRGGPGSIQTGGEEGQSQGEGAPPRKSDATGAGAGPEKILDDETAAKLVRVFGIPRAQIEKLLGDVEKRL